MSAAPMTTTETKTLPQRPLPYLSGLPSAIIDLTSLGKQVAAAEIRRQESFDLSRQIQVQLIQSRAAQQETEQKESNSKNSNNLDEELDRLIALANTQTTDSTDPQESNMRVPREANLSYRMEDCARYKAFQFFLQTGRLLPPSQCHFATDEEYLGGAVIGLAQDLARYSVGRATVRDVASVELAAQLVRSMQEVLLEFDFRNGPLRRKFDGTKYALKSVETILYELSVTGATTSADDDNNKEETHPRKAKRTKTMSESDNKEEGAEETPFSSLPHNELTALRKRMEHRDELREELIKKCRDGQKAAKQAIFALHRGDQKRAASLMKSCEDCVVKQLWPIIQEEPSLRHGSFANVLEEYVEAKLFYVWLHGGNKDKSDESNGIDPMDIVTNSSEVTPATKREEKKLLLPDEFFMKLEPEEYVGGLCDLTGEIGRFAVQRGTMRDSKGVRLCLETNFAILIALQSMERIPGGHVGKKMDPLRRSVEKLERMLYEMSLVEATGGRTLPTHDDEDIKNEE